MQHKERRAANYMAIHVALLTVFDVLRPTQSCSCLWCPFFTITVFAFLPARQGPIPRTTRGAQNLPRHSRTRQPALDATTRGAQNLPRHSRTRQPALDVSACFATTLVGRWQLVRRRLGWTRGAQLVSFMFYALARSNTATLR